MLRAESSKHQQQEKEIALRAATTRNEVEALIRPCREPST
jgi:hypothetical protein